jgi:hypothetical protein
VVEARLRGQPVQATYRRMIASEVRRCSDQWNPLRIAVGRPHEADFRKALFALAVRDQARLLWETWKFIGLFARHNWGRQILAQALSRQWRDGYDPSRWL